MDALGIAYTIAGSQASIYYGEPRFTQDIDVGHIITGKFWLDNTPEDLHWTISDTGWAQAAWTCFFAPWNMGAAIFVWDARGKKFDSQETLAMFERFPITTFFAPPTAYRMMVQEPLRKFRYPTLRH